MSLKGNNEQISFVLSDLQRHGQPSMTNEVPIRRRNDDARSVAAAAAAAAGVCNVSELEADVEQAATDAGQTRVDARRVPLKLKQNSCFSTLAGVWMLISVVFAALFLVQIAMTMHPGLLESVGTEHGLERRLARDITIRDRCTFGIWDSRGAITQLQLQVGVSMALGVRADDDDVHVDADENYFFHVAVEHATIEEAEFVASKLFADKLNAQLSHYGGIGVLSKPPRLLKNHSDPV